MLMVLFVGLKVPPATVPLRGEKFSSNIELFGSLLSMAVVTARFISLANVGELLIVACRLVTISCVTGWLCWFAYMYELFAKRILISCSRREPRKFIVGADPGSKAGRVTIPDALS
ncbi:hypothetical protein AC028_08895 [Xanthomonas citri pv. aurantifolii]|nr:hypothetical protein AC028_08895 [Xanthomonas citri pv. aurantifolii]ARE55279.1 hypothetical protein TP45_02225 [Xanthomonas citri pv. aurantifolii]